MFIGGRGRVYNHTSLVVAMVDPTVVLEDLLVASLVVMMVVLMAFWLVVWLAVVMVDLLVLLLPVTKSNVQLIVCVPLMMMMMMMMLTVNCR